MKKLIGGQKDEHGLYIQNRPQEEVEPTDISIDDLLKAGLQAIRKAMKCVKEDINTGAPSRETIMNLKDLMSMLKDLKKEEREFLDNLTDEQLEQLSKK